MTRWKAALLHLCISALIASIASALLLGLWYPPPYFHAAGGEVLLILVVGVDITLGPLITLIIFKSGKHGLKLDLAIIGIVQAAALAYGFHVMLESRPVFMVAAVDRFVLIDANQLDPKDLAEASQPRWRHLSWTGPVLVAARIPTNPEESNKLLFSALAGKKDVAQLPRYYVDYDKAVQTLLKRAQPLDRLREMHPGHAIEINHWLQQHHTHADQVVWVPIVTRGKDLCMLMNRNTGKPLGAIALNPWMASQQSGARKGSNPD